MLATAVMPNMPASTVSPGATSRKYNPAAMKSSPPKRHVPMLPRSGVAAAVLARLEGGSSMDSFRDAHGFNPFPPPKPDRHGLGVAERRLSAGGLSAGGIRDRGRATRLPAGAGRSGRVNPNLRLSTPGLDADRAALMRLTRAQRSPASCLPDCLRELPEKAQGNAILQSLRLLRSAGRTPVARSCTHPGRINAASFVEETLVRE